VGNKAALTLAINDLDDLKTVGGF